MSNLSFNNTNLSVVTRDDQSWLTSKSLASALGYKDVSSVGRIYGRNSDEFTDTMTLTVNLTVSKGKAGETRIFSLRGCHLIAMFSKTTLSKKFRQWVLDVLDDELSQPQAEEVEVPVLTSEQHDHLRARAGEIAEENSPFATTGDIGKKLIEIFQVRNPKSIPRHRYPEACKILKCEPKYASLGDKITVKRSDLNYLYNQIERYKSVAGQSLVETPDYQKVIGSLEKDMGRSMWIGGAV